LNLDIYFDVIIILKTTPYHLKMFRNWFRTFYRNSFFGTYRNENPSPLLVSVWFFNYVPWFF